MPRVPRYRDDAKGKVKENIADFRAQVQGELSSDTGTFPALVQFDETHAYDEYKDILTDDEMRRAHQAAVKAIA